MKFSHLILIGALVMTASCARKLSPNEYIDSSTSGMVLEGVIVSARPVTVRGSDNLGDNGAGLLGGGLVGGIAGNQFGGGSGNTAATVGGVLVGAALGSVLQDQLSNDAGMEYIVKLNSNNIDKDSGYKEELTVNSGSKKPSTKTINSNLKSELISVVQGADVAFAKGTPVYIVYSDDRPRLIAR